MADLAKLAQERIEAAAESVTESRCAYVEDVPGRHFHTTVCNGEVKPEGGDPTGEVASADDVPVDAFVARCLSFKGSARRLVWRRLPAIDHDHDRGLYRITARLSWVDAPHG